MFSLTSSLLVVRYNVMRQSEKNRSFHVQVDQDFTETFKSTE